MTTRLEIINNALLNTGNDPCSIEFDGSSEWAVAYAAYNRALGTLLEEHDWNFGTTTAVLARTGASADPRFTDAFAKPSDALMIRTLFLGGSSTPIQQWDIQDNQILCSYDGAVTALYVREPATSAWPHVFVEALTLKVEAGCLRGLNEDYGEARNVDVSAERALSKAETKTDQQTPGRNMYRSRTAAARRRRRV
jgi:hypothetical protein